MQQIDLNADIGESFGSWRMGDDEALVPLLSSANIACGFHAGDADVMARSIALCAKHGVAIGAHPSFPDRQGFGRRQMTLTADEIHGAVLYQIGALAAFARAEGLRLRHVKPHGALYNLAAGDRGTADAIARAVRDFDAGLLLVGLANSQLIEAGRAMGLGTLAEGFADRRYVAGGLLAPRSRNDALIRDEEEAVQQVLQMVGEGSVRCLDGSVTSLLVDTVCVHGDGEHAIAFARRLRQALQQRQISVRAVST